VATILLKKDATSSIPLNSTYISNQCELSSAGFSIPYGYSISCQMDRCPHGV
jgi:hypothetical protein